MRNDDVYVGLRPSSVWKTSKRRLLMPPANLLGARAAQCTESLTTHTLYRSLCLMLLKMIPPQAKKFLTLLWSDITAPAIVVMDQAFRSLLRQRRTLLSWQDHASQIVSSTRKVGLCVSVAMFQSLYKWPRYNVYPGALRGVNMHHLLRLLPDSFLALGHPI